MSIGNKFPSKYSARITSLPVARPITTTKTEDKEWQCSRVTFVKDMGQGNLSLIYVGKYGNVFPCGDQRSGKKPLY